MSGTPQIHPVIEDNWFDVVEKARRGRKIDRCALCSRAGIEPKQWREAGHSEADEDMAIRSGKALGLSVLGLLALLRGSYKPGVTAPKGLVPVYSPFPQPGFPEGSVSAYLVLVPGTNDALLFDGGSEPAPVLCEIEERQLNISAIFITHAHPDHIAALPTVHSTFPDAPVYCHKAEVIAPCMTPLEDGAIFEAGPLKVEARHTPGHTKGGMSYYVTGLEKPLVFTGDALFAGSLGRADDAWNEALEALRQKILTLPPETVLCPGHGPISSIAYESAHNPVLVRNS